MRHKDSNTVLTEDGVDGAVMVGAGRRMVMVGELVMVREFKIKWKNQILSQIPH